MRSVTLLDFRRQTRRLLAAVEQGERLILTVRGRPVARLEPVRAAVSKGESDDPLLRLDDYTVDGPGSPLPNADMDRLIHGA